MSTPEAAQNFQHLVPASPRRTSEVVQCEDSRVGEAFFAPLRGARITGLSIHRFPTHDVVALTTADRRAMVIAAERDGFIAVELHDYKDPKRRANLTFRDDISHRRLNLALSTISGGDVTYLDPKTVSGEMLPVDPAGKFAEFAFEQEAVIDTAQPTWYTEDWVTVRLQDGRNIVIRADRLKLTGAVKIDPEGVDYLNTRGDVSVIQLEKPEQYSPNARFLPGSK